MSCCIKGKQLAKPLDTRPIAIKCDYCSGYVNTVVTKNGAIRKCVVCGKRY